MGRITEEEARNFRNASGYQTLRKKMLCSCSMREYLEFMDSKVYFPNESEKVTEDFINALKEALIDVS